MFNEFLQPISIRFRLYFVILYPDFACILTFEKLQELDELPEFSKSVLDIKTRYVVTVEPRTKWMPNSDSALKLIPECKILGQYDTHFIIHTRLHGHLYSITFWNIKMTS